MNIKLKPMLLTFERHGNTWDKVITDFYGNIIYEQRGIKLFDEMLNKEYFDGWEKQLRSGPWWNIVEVKRFI